VKDRPANPLHRLRRPAWAQQQPTWADAKPGQIRAALNRALDRPSGGWFVLAASREVRPGRAFGRVVAGRELVAWRDDDGALHVGPGACPHLGAALCDAPVHDGQLVCRWHGLSLGAAGRPGWHTLPAHDDGVLAWVRLDDLAAGPLLDAPVLGPRPPAERSVAAVATVIGRCEPEDVLANRLDPWHGDWLHPYSFAGLRVVSTPPADATPTEDRLLVEVTFTIGRRLGVPVFAEFSCPDPRTITMEIVDGEGAGSVVETHATPLRPGTDGRSRTAVIEAVVAHSDRRGFEHSRRVAALLRPMITMTARRLWRDDMVYAERRYEQRARSVRVPTSTSAPQSTTAPASPTEPSRSPSRPAASPAAVNGSNSASSAPRLADVRRSPRK